ncbi:unnamed protein product [Meloidogyne enterolobii]|uniref:Uncharacterized protein n=1 Tax=Meloidogyne enterolobii TaxID=390850 RepID=A0ACB0ZNT2_MELEN
MCQHKKINALYFENQISTRTEFWLRGLKFEFVLGRFYGVIIVPIYCLYGIINECGVII